MTEPYRAIVPKTVYRYPGGEEVHDDGPGQRPEVRTPLDDLDSMEKAFVTFFMEMGDAREAARRAHYSRDVQLCASVLLNMPHIRKAIRAMRASRRESSRELIEIGAHMGVQTLIRTLMDEEAPLQFRLQSAAMLNSRSGVTPGKDMRDDLTDDAALEKISSARTALALAEQQKAQETEVEVQA